MFTPQVCSAAATLDFDLDNITLSAVKSLVLGVLSAVIDAGPSDSQIDAIAVALVEKVFKPVTEFIASLVLLKVGGQIEPGARLVGLCLTSFYYLFPKTSSRNFPMTSSHSSALFTTPFLFLPLPSSEFPFASPMSLSICPLGLLMMTLSSKRRILITF